MVLIVTESSARHGGVLADGIAPLSTRPSPAWLEDIIWSHHPPFYNAVRVINMALNKVEQRADLSSSEAREVRNYAESLLAACEKLLARAAQEPVVFGSFGEISRMPMVGQSRKSMSQIS